MVQVIIVFSDASIDVISATLKDINTDISYAISTAFVTTLSTPTLDINALKVGANTYSAIIPAQDISDSNTLFVSYSTEYNDYTAESIIAGYTFSVPGKSYTVNVAAL